MVFLSDYDMDLTEQLVRGVDVWLNTPRRFLDIGGVLLTMGGTSCPQTGGYAGVGRDGATASPDLRHPRGKLTQLSI